MNKHLLKLLLFLGICFFIKGELLQAKHCLHFASTSHEDSINTAKIARAKKPKDHPTATAGNLSQNFGKTHFIIGTSSQSVQEALQTDNSSTKNKSTEEAIPTTGSEHAYFSPDDGLQKILLDLIANEKTSIKIAIFLFTNGDIAQALLTAKEHGVSIEIVTDPSCIQDKFNKMKLLHEAGIPIYIYNPEDTGSLYGNRMHHKFIIFSNNKEGKQLLWFGSFNLTKTADLYNQEAVVLSESQYLITQFVTRFDVLKKRCLCYQNKKKELADPFSTAIVTAKNRKSCIKKPRKVHNKSKRILV